MSENISNELIASLQKAVTDFLVPLQNSRVVKRDAFDKLLLVSHECARQLKGTETVSKVLLNELYVTFQIIQREAPYLKHEEAILYQMANKLEFIFALMLRNETEGDRVPGVPRIL